MLGFVEDDCGSNISPSVSKDQVCDCLRNVNVCKSVGPHEMYPRVLKELADVVIKPHLAILEKTLVTGRRAI